MLFEPQRSVAFGVIGAAYIGVGTALDHPIRQFLIQNLTDVTLQFSFDGVNDHFPIPSNGFFLNDITSNKALGPGFTIAEGSRLYVKNLGVPASGAVYFTTMYGKE